MKRRKIQVEAEICEVFFLYHKYDETGYNASNDNKYSRVENSCSDNSATNFDCSTVLSKQ